MLSAQIPNSPVNRTATSRWMVAIIVALMFYTLLVGWGLIGNFLVPARAYLLLALPCIAPIVWYAYGFLKVNEAEQDFGLLLSALGWAFVAISLLIQHSAALRAIANADATPDSLKPASAVVCAIFAFVCLLLGAVLAWHSWSREHSPTA